MDSGGEGPQRTSMTLSPASTSASIEANSGVSHRTSALREQFPTLSQMMVGPCGSRGRRAAKSSSFVRTAVPSRTAYSQTCASSASRNPTSTTWTASWPASASISLRPGGAGHRLGSSPISGDQDRVVRLRSSEGQTGADIFPLEIGKIGEHFCLAHTGSEQIEDVLNSDTHAPDARSIAALVWIERDAIHTESLTRVLRTVKAAPIHDMERAGIDIITDGESAAKATRTALRLPSRVSISTTRRSEERR